MSVQEIQNGFEAALAARTPFVVRGVTADWRARAAMLEEIHVAIESNEAGRYWYDVAQDDPFAAKLPRPDWLGAHWRRLETDLSLERPIRFWRASEGHTTPWHYDGNALDVVNIQLSGAKHFTLVSPDHELPWIRFLPISTLAYEDARAPTAQVTLEGGDLIFIPRFWSHLVRGVDETSYNINWVWTDSAFAADSVVAAREAERLAAISLLAGEGRLETLLTPHEAAFLRQELKSYGGMQRDALIAHMLEAVTPEGAQGHVDIDLHDGSTDAFIDGLDARGQGLLARELFGRAGRADDALVDA